MHFKPSCDVIKAEEFSKETFTKTRQTNNNSKLHLQCIVSLASIALVELEIKLETQKNVNFTIKQF